MLQRAPVLPTLLLVTWNRFIEMRLGKLGSKILQGALVLLMLAMLPAPRLVSRRQMVAGTARSVTHMWVAKPTWPIMSGVITRVYPGVREKQWLNTSMVCHGGSVGDVFGLPHAGPVCVVVAGSLKIRRSQAELLTAPYSDG